MDRVIVPAESAVAGDIRAEAVVVRGMVFGYILAREVTLEESGRVWGDIYTVAMHMKPGARLSGWTYTIEEERYEAIRKGNQPPEPPRDQLAALPDPLREAVDRTARELPAELAALLTGLRDETAASRLARLELENDFDKRLHAISADRFARAEELEKNLEMLKTERNKLQLRISVLSAQIQEERSENSQAQTTISELKHELDQGIEKTIALENQIQLKEDQIRGLEAEKEALSGQLQELTARFDQQVERGAGLESALENSLQRQSEQDEALARWQELAEANENAAREAQEALDQAELQGKESEALIESLRRKKEELESAREEADAEIAALREKITDQAASAQLAEQLQRVEEELARKTREMEVSKQALVESTAAYAEANQQIARLEKELADSLAELEPLPAIRQELADLQAHFDDLTAAHPHLEELVEQIKELENRLADAAAGRATLETELETAQEALAAQKETVETLQTSLTEQTAALEKAQAGGVRLEEKSADLEERLADIQETNESLQAALNEARATIAELEQKAVSRIQNHEKDLQYYAEQFDEQGERLASAPVDLVVKEVALKNLQEKLDFHANELRRFRSGAAHHIRALQAELTEKTRDLEKLRQKIKG